MKLRTWPILALGFGSMVLLTILFGLDNMHRGMRIYSTIVSIHQLQDQTENALRNIESGIYVSGIYARDFLLDPSHLTASLYRERLLDTRSSMENALKELNHLTDPGQEKVLDQLRREIDAYWASMDPMFDWTPQQKLSFSAVFLRKQVLPRRNAVLEMAQEIKALNEVNLQERQKQIDLRLSEFRESGRNILLIAITLGIAVSVASIIRISRLESRAEQQHERTERAEQELRRLSQQLVHAQEDERRSLSRELHDAVGQTLTALRVELGNLEKLRFSSDEQFRSHMDDAKNLAEQTLRSVRSLAMLLRPAILDDLGLGPALEWQAREFSRRSGLPVEVLMDGLPADLPDQHRTCLYRVVQEALTNCARHADAKNIRIVLHSETDRLSLTVQDDGKGLPSGYDKDRTDRPTLGLVGIEERVREIGGNLAIRSQPGRGTLLKVVIPLRHETKV